uniref:Hamartin n=1 Tax=Cacopsylla melanoneura TaxID=428564 RepID=A0A8D8QP64_9HEMI
MDTSTAQLFRALESNQTQSVDDAKDRFRNQFNSSKEPWLVNGLVDYFLVSNSIRAVDVLVIVREPHDRFLFDRISEILRSPTTRLGALTLLGHIVQRQTTWLYKIVHHPTLMKDLLRILKTDMDMVEVISALLVLNILLPIIPGLIGSHLTEIFEVFSRLAAWNSDAPRQLTSSHVLHLQVALYALFYQLYGMFPCTFIEYLKQEYNVKCDSTNACNVFQHTIKPMIETVRLHPFLILSSTEEELCKERWKKSEHHAVVFNCTRFLLDGTSESALRPLSLSSLDMTASLESSTRLPGGVIDSTGPAGGSEPNSPNPSSSLHSSYLLNGMDSPRFSLCCHLSGNTTPAPPHPPPPETTPTSIPNTPLYKLYPSSLSFPQQEGSSPPEAAIEATPETTPVKDIRPRGRSHTTSSASTSTAVCALTDFTSPSNENRKHGGSSDTPSSPSLLRTRGDLFNFPSSSSGGVGGERKPLALARLIDERLMAQEAALQGSSSSTDQRKPPSAPTSPLTLAPPTSGLDSLSLDENNSEPLHNSSESHSHSKLMSGEGGDGFPEDPCSGDQGGEGSEGACSTGGLHMPNILLLRRHRPRYLTECTLPTSQSLGLSSPRDVFPLGEPETRVRRAMSCPEMKKSGGGSMTGSVGSAGPPLPEEQDEGDDHPPAGSRLRLVACSTEDATTQTDDHPPTQHSYEHLFLGLFPSTFSYHHVHHHHHHFDMTSPQYPSHPLPGDDSSPYLTGHSLEPCCVRGPGRGEGFNNTSLEGSNMLVTRTPGNNFSVESELRFYKEQVSLMNLQLHFERHRRQVHLERNRRLLGKSRNNRASEEHNSALRDQVSLLQKDIERSSEGMRVLSADQRPLVEALETNVAKLKQENAQLHRDIGKIKTKCETLEQETKNEHEKRSILNEILHETKAKLFDSNNEMEHYKAAIAENKRLNNDLGYLQKEIIILGEMNSKYKDILSYLAQMKNEYSYSALFNEAYVHQIEQLHKLSDTQARHLESARNQNIRLEQLLAEKEKTIGGFKHLFTTVKTKYQEDLEAMTSRYRSVEASLARQRNEQLELFYQFDLNKMRLAKLSKHPGPATDKRVPLGAQGPPLPSSSHSNPTHLLSLSSFVEPTPPISSTPTEGQNSTLLEE